MKSFKVILSDGQEYEVWAEDVFDVVNGTVDGADFQDVIRIDDVISVTLIP